MYLCAQEMDAIRSKDKYAQLLPRHRRLQQLATKVAKRRKKKSLLLDNPYKAHILKIDLYSNVI